MEQTAVEWLDRWFRDNSEATHEEGNNALQQAKQMEKEQIVNAHLTGLVYPLEMDASKQAEQYYKDNYKK